MIYTQTYDPFNNKLISTLIASLPIILLLGGMVLFKLRAQIAAAIGLAVAMVISITAYHMPVSLSGMSALYGMAYGLLPIGWIIINILFLFRLVEDKGLFSQLQSNLTSITPDQRLQLLIVVVCLGSFFEGISGFGAPVAITAVILIGLGFPKLQACVLSLIGNSASVVFGSIGTGLIALQGVTNLDLLSLSKAAAVQLIPLCLMLAAWLVWTFSGFKRMLAIWPAILVVSITFAAVHTAVAVWHGPWLPSVAAASASLVALLLLLRFWKPREVYQPYHPAGNINPVTPAKNRPGGAWMPWIVVSLVVFVWGIPVIKTFLDSTTIQIMIPVLNGAVFRSPPLVVNNQPASAIFSFNWLSSIGTAVLLSSILAGFGMGHTPRSMLIAYGATIKRASGTLLTICLLIALGFISRYTGLDATIGLAFARSGFLYPFFGTLLGWLGVLSTGSITASNVLFGNLQQISAGQIGIDPVVMAAANATGGVAGKLISPQSIAITATATDQPGGEPAILRRSLPHSLGMALLMGLVVIIEAYLL